MRPRAMAEVVRCKGRVADILGALERIRGFVFGGRRSFFGDSKTHLAAAYEALKMGEGANGTSPGFRRAHAAVPWRRLIALRNELVQEHFRGDLESLGEFIESELPAVQRALGTL